jgi:CHAT domain-containing protein
MVRQKMPDDFNLLGRTHQSLGNIHNVEKQYDLAITNYEEAITYFKRAERYGSIGSTFNNIAIIYLSKHDYDNALRHLNEAIRFERLANNQESAGTATRYLNKGFVFRRLSYPDSAEFYYREALRIRKTIFGEKGINTFGAREALGKFFQEQNNPDSSAHYYHLSLNSLIKAFNSSFIRDLPQPDQSEISLDLVNVLVNKAIALKKLAVRKGDWSLMEYSLEHMHLADSVMAIYRQYLPYEDQQFSLMQNSNATTYLSGFEFPYQTALECAFALYDKTNEARYVQEGLNFMEHSRATRLLDVLNQAELYNQAGIPKELHNKQNELYRQRANILQAYRDDISDSLDQELFIISEQLEGLKKSLIAINPNYTLTKFYQKVPDIKDLTVLAEKHNAVLLEYYWSGDDLFILVISANQAKLSYIKITPDVRTSLKEMLKALGSPPDDIANKTEYKKFVNNAYLLYQVLIRRQIQDIKAERLIISPHGLLSYLPFEVLLENLPDTTEVNYKLPYLLHHYTVSYTNGLQFLVRPKRKMNSENKLLAMGFSSGNPGLNETFRKGLNNLPGTVEEIRSIKEVMKNSKNAYYIGSDASETTLKKNIADYNMVHLAVHGEGDSLNALNSRLIFRNDSDSLNDGSLYSHELYGMDLRNTKLVVLSACESGIGKQQPGEGFLSIARGFAYAGCASQVISLWKVEDRTTAQVMSRFYKYLSVKNNPVDVSMALAKCNYIASANEFNAHPTYWAAYLQMGSNVILEEKRIFELRWLLYGFLLFVLSFLVWRVFGKFRKQ